MFLSAKLSGVDEYVKLLKGRKSPCSQLILKNRIVFLFLYSIHLRVILAWPFRFWYWFCSSFNTKVDFLKVVRLVFWSGVVGPARSRFALTVALRAQKLDLWASLILRVRFFTKISDQKSGSIGFCRWEKKRCIQRDYYSFISLETTHNIDSIPGKECHSCWQRWKFTTFIVFWTVSLRALL